MIVADIWMFATSERIEFQPAEMDIFKEKKKKRKKSKGIDRMSKKRRAMNLAFLLFIGWLEEKYFREKHSCRKQAVRLMEDSRRTSSPDRNIVGDSKTRRLYPTGRSKNGKRNRATRRVVYWHWVCEENGTSLRERRWVSIILC
jgi:hypothetical protein